MPDKAVSSAPRQRRRALKREQILAAAMFCIQEQGIHGSAMARIAQVAGLSVGQLYRYFAHKQALVEALARHLVQRQLAWAKSALAYAAPPETITLRLDEESSAERRQERYLLLEFHAEAARNPEVARILTEGDRQMREFGLERIRARYPDWSKDKIAVRVELMTTLAEGRLLRADKTVWGKTPAFLKLHDEVLAFLFPKAGSSSDCN